MIWFCRFLLVLVILPSAIAQARDDVYYIDDALKPLPEAAMQWHKQQSFGGNKVYEMYRAVAPLQDGRVVAAGQGGSDVEGVLNAGVVALYDAAGQEIWRYATQDQGYGNFYDVIVQSDIVILFGEYADEDANDVGWEADISVDDKLTITILALDSGALLYHDKIGHDEGSLYSPHVVQGGDSVIYLKALLRGADWQEKTQTYRVDITHNDAAINAEFIALAQFAGRSYAINKAGDDLILAGSVQAAQIIGVQGGAAKTLYTSDAAQSNFAGLAVQAQGYFAAGEVMGDHVRHGQMVSLDKDLNILWQKNVEAHEPSFIAARNITVITPDIYALLFYVEPRNPDLQRYSALLFVKNDGQICTAYRLGDAEKENYIAGAVSYKNDRLWIGGARADNAKLSGLSGSALQKARFLAYNTDIMALDMTRLNTCQ